METQSVRITTSRWCGKGKRVGGEKKDSPCHDNEVWRGRGRGKPFLVPDPNIRVYIYIYVCVSWLFARLRRVLQGFRKGDSLRLLGPLNYRDVG